jgi:hypothetical protein
MVTGKKSQGEMYQSQEEMWKEFNNYFRDQKRDPGKHVNHHDFIDPNFLEQVKEQSRRTFFTNVGKESLDKSPLYPYEEERNQLVDLGQHRFV